MTKIRDLPGQLKLFPNGDGAETRADRSVPWHTEVHGQPEALIQPMGEEGGGLALAQPKEEPRAQPKEEPMGSATVVSTGALTQQKDLEAGEAGPLGDNDRLPPLTLLTIGRLQDTIRRGQAANEALNLMLHTILEVHAIKPGDELNLETGIITRR